MTASHTYTLDPERHISCVKITIDRLILITGVAMLYSDGATAFSHKFDQCGVEHTIEIAEGHQIVGLYGRQECEDITALGFITFR